ncbi:MAG: OsmC family protein [Cyanobacteria bacterium REEB65]|nr:OsmC family protein [Cyanobacteria bacterium REEB65]
MQGRKRVIEVHVRSLTGDQLAQEVRFGNGTVVADEPIGAGGQGRGPSPYELLLGALGSCTAMTLQLYARRKDWPLQGVQVTLAHDRIHAEDCGECETREGYLDEIRKDIRLTGPLDDEQRQRLLEIARRCPVNLTLQREVRILDALVV